MIDSRTANIFQGINLGGWSVPRLLDMDDDHDLDIVAGNEWGQLFYFENIGQANSPDWIEVAGFFGGIDSHTFDAGLVERALERIELRAVVVVDHR